jgi:hypothetical protein
MQLIREVFFCKPGQVRPLADKFKMMNKVMERMGQGKARIMTDLSAERYWTLVMGKEMETVMKGYHEHVDSGRREIYNIEE